jgi:hypothetical protein
METLDDTSIDKCCICDFIVSANGVPFNKRSSLMLLGKIDDFFFDKLFQPASDWFCDQTGRTPHWIAVIIAYICGALVMWQALVYPPDSWTSYIFDGIVIFSIGAIVIQNERADRRKGAGFMNPLRQAIPMRLLRVFGFVFMFFSMTHFFSPEVVVGKEIILMLRIVCFTCVLYFGACETKPPAPPKKKTTISPVSARA